nr:hypothetical protein [Tanacetum cinerariifolium]
MNFMQQPMQNPEDNSNVENQVVQNAIQNPGIQAVEIMNGLSVVLKIANQYGNGDVVTTSAEGNVKPKKQDAAYLQQQLQITQEEEAGIQSTKEEFEFMAAANAYEETERVKANYILENNLQQASTSGTQSDNAPTYDTDGSTERSRKNTKCVNADNEELTAAKHKLMMLVYCC